MNNDAQEQNSSVLIYFNIVVWLLCCSCCHYIYVDAGRQVSAYIFFSLVEKLNDENGSKVKLYVCRFFGVFLVACMQGDVMISMRDELYVKLKFSS